MRAVISFHGSGNLPFRKVNQEFLKKFETYLRGKDCSWNTVSTYMRTLRAVYNRAVDRHLALYVPHHFRYVYTGTRADRKRALGQRGYGTIDGKAAESALFRNQRLTTYTCLLFINVYASRHSIRRPCLLEEA